MKKVDIYEPYVNYRCQKLHASMRKMAQSDWSRAGRLYIYKRPGREIRPDSPN